MLDREKVIKGLELCEIGSGEKCFETDCPYYYQECTEDLKNDIFELLKEQEAVKPTWQQGKAYCGSCGKRIPLKIGARFCHKCGQAVEWK